MHCRGVFTESLRLPCAWDCDWPGCFEPCCCYALGGRIEWVEGERPVAIQAKRRARSRSCSCCGARLNLIRLTEAQRAAVRRELLTRSAPRNPQKQHRLISFSQWLSNRAPFDYVLDGPNLAYAKQNFEGGKFRFEHLDAIVRHLQGRQKRVLVLLPNKYLTGSDIPNRTSSSKRSSKMTDADRALITDWQRSMSGDRRPESRDITICFG